jgi:hypothetical protein
VALDPVTQLDRLRRDRDEPANVRCDPGVLGIEVCADVPVSEESALRAVHPEGVASNVQIAHALIGILRLDLPDDAADGRVMEREEIVG